MKNWKLISGILSIALSLLIFSQSSRLLDLAEIFGVDGIHLYSGIFAAILLIISGVISIIYREKNNRVVDVLIILLCFGATLLCFMGPKIYEDLPLYSVWPIICSFVAIISLLRKKNRGEEQSKQIIQNVSSTVECPHCHNQITGSGAFCEVCGKELPKKHFCSNCGALYWENDKFCQNCGANFSEESVEPSTTINQEIDSVQNTTNASLDEDGGKRKWWIYVLIGIFTSVIISGGWKYWESVKERRIADAEREKFVADSLLRVKKDSLAKAEAFAKDSLERLAKLKPIETIRVDLKKSIDESDYDVYLEYPMSGNDEIVLKLRNDINDILGEDCTRYSGDLSDIDKMKKHYIDEFENTLGEPDEDGNYVMYSEEVKAKKSFEKGIYITYELSRETMGASASYDERIFTYNKLTGLLLRWDDIFKCSESELRNLMKQYIGDLPFQDEEEPSLPIHGCGLNKEEVVIMTDAWRFRNAYIRIPMSSAINYIKEEVISNMK